jgi:hypothetical protein
MTQFGRALHALNIDIICANSSSAKGRVERAHKTLQDRLVKELRLAGVRTLAEGNALLPVFIADYNARFAKPPANKKDLHRPLRAGDDLEDTFAWKEERTLSQALTLQYDKVIFILEPSEQAKAAIGKRVAVFDYPDGWLSIRYNGVEFAYRTFDKVRQVDQGAIADNKRLGPILAMIRNEQRRGGSESRSGPRRAISAMPVCSRSAEALRAQRADARSVKQRVQFQLRSIGRRSGAALRKGSAPARRPAPPAQETFVNGRDICIWWTHDRAARPVQKHKKENWPKASTQLTVIRFLETALDSIESLTRANIHGVCEHDPRCRHNKSCLLCLPDHTPERPAHQRT